MGMLDRDLGKPWSENFEDGQVFTLQEAKLGPEVSTDYGRGRPAMLRIDGDWYSIWGEGITNQVQDLEKGELPAKVKVIRQPTKIPGQAVKLIVPHDQDDIPF